MFKLGGANPPQIQFLTSFVCGQHIKIDTYFVLCAKQQPTCRDIFNIKYSPKIEEKRSGYFAGYICIVVLITGNNSVVIVLNLLKVYVLTINT